MPISEIGSPQAILRVHGHGEILASDAAEFLEAMNDCYSSLIAFESIITRAERWRPWRYFSDEYYPGLFGIIQHAPASAYVPSGRGLQLRATSLASPGFWDFLGDINPLQQIRKYLNDKHERDKDRAYRSAAEEERLRTEQTMREIEAIGRALELAERHGATREELTPLLDQLVHRPLERLGRVQTARVIEHTEIKQIEDKRDQPPRS